MLRIIATGYKGRMGQRVCALLKESPDLTLAACVDVGDSLEAALARGADAIIDFTSAAASAANAHLAALARIPIVIGATGINDDQKNLIAEASRTIPIVQSSNMSIGVNVMWSLIERAARTLGTGYTVDIEETHHVHKLDRPSGTAKIMVECVRHGLGKMPAIVELEEQQAWTRTSGDVAVSVRSFRESEVVGDHTITFTGPGETLSLSHHAMTRDIFANGAIAAARWIAGKPAGLYSMMDVLGLKG